MKAISQEGDDLIWKESQDPDLKKDEVLIRIKASAINRADLLQRGGNYPVPPGASPILGLECAGVVEEVGGQVRNFIKGEEVCALLAGGGYAEKVSVPSGQVLKVPKGFSFEQAAALPEVFATAYFNLYMEANLSVGEKTLIHAGASGVGTAAIQICKAKGKTLSAKILLGIAFSNQWAKSKFPFGSVACLWLESIVVPSKSNIETCLIIFNLSLSYITNIRFLNVNVKGCNQLFCVFLSFNINDLAK